MLAPRQARRRASACTTSAPWRQTCRANALHARAILTGRHPHHAFISCCRAALAALKKRARYMTFGQDTPLACTPTYAVVPEQRVDGGDVSHALAPAHALRMDTNIFRAHHTRTRHAPHSCLLVLRGASPLSAQQPPGTALPTALVFFGFRLWFARFIGRGLTVQPPAPFFGRRLPVGRNAFWILRPLLTCMHYRRSQFNHPILAPRGFCTRSWAVHPPHCPTTLPPAYHHHLTTTTTCMHYLILGTETFKGHVVRLCRSCISCRWPTACQFRTTRMVTASWRCILYMTVVLNAWA